MSERRPLWRWIDALLPWAAFGYNLFSAALTFGWNAELGYPLPEDYKQGKWRGEYEDFAGFLLFFGLWVYPLSLGLIYYFRQRFLLEKKIYRKMVCLFVCLVCLLILLQFFRLGVGPDVGEGGRSE